MRLNKLIALATSVGRRPADKAIASGRVIVNGSPGQLGQEVSESDIVSLDGTVLPWPTDASTTIMLNKPVGYVVSRNGQGSNTVYDLLPEEYKSLKPIGRLDKDSSGLLLLTNDGQLANELTHPSHQKLKIYDVDLGTPLAPLHHQIITSHGVLLDDGPSQFQLERLEDGNDKRWQVSMREGRNRQIRRTFEALGYRITRLHRRQFGPYQLGDLRPGSVRAVTRI